MVGIVAGAAIAEADVQVTVGTERQMSAVMIRERVIDKALRPAEQQVEARHRIGHEPIARSAKARDDVVAGWIRERHKKPAAIGVIGRKGQTEQAAFAAKRDAVRDVEKIGRKHGAVLHNADAPVLLHDKLDIAIRRVLHECHGNCKSSGMKPASQLCVRFDRDRDAHSAHRRGDERLESAHVVSYRMMPEMLHRA